MPRKTKLEQLEAEPLPKKPKRRGKAEPRPASELAAEVLDPLHREQKALVEDHRAEQDEPANIQGFAERIHPSGPRKRDGEPFVSYTSANVRVEGDGMPGRQSWQVQVGRDLTAEENARMQASGFDPADTDPRVQNAHQQELVRQGTDLNHVAVALDKKFERLKGPAR